jgi:hypothetical protein
MPSTKPGFRRLLMAKVPFSLCSGSGRSLALLPGLGTEQKGVLLDEVVHIADVLPWGIGRSQPLQPRSYTCNRRVLMWLGEYHAFECPAK